MGKLQEYFMKNKKELPDVIETTSGETLTAVKKHEKIKDKDAVPHKRIYTGSIAPPTPLKAWCPSGEPFMMSYLPDDPIIKNIKAVITVEEWEILRTTTFHSPQEQILRYADIITRLATADNIFDKKSDTDKEKSE